LQRSPAGRHGRWWREVSRPPRRCTHSYTTGITESRLERRLGDAPGAIAALLSAAGDRNVCTAARSLILDALADGLSAAAHGEGAVDVCLRLVCDEAHDETDSSAEM
jgi:hypothetical protein